MADTLTPAAALYAGRVAHIRHSPFRHRFDYRIWMMAVDLDRMDEVAAETKLFAHNKAGFISIHDKDHGFRDGRSLRAFVEDALAGQGLGEFGARIDFITIPRLFGYAFNPISFYYCHDASGRLGAVLHQVKNTFGGQIGYLLAVNGSENKPGMIRQEAAKQMYVSPFFDMKGGYKFYLSRPEEKLSVVIQYGDETQKRMTASMVLHKRPFTDALILRLCAQMPFTPMKVILAIHWQALRLFLRGAKFNSAPQMSNETVIAGERP